MSGQQGPGINPFANPPPATQFSYDIQTTYVPHAEGTVPAVPMGHHQGPPPPGPPPGYAQAMPMAPAGTVPAVPAGAPQAPPQQSSGFRLPFMSG